DPGGAAHRVDDHQSRLFGGASTNSGHFRAFGKNWFEIGCGYVPLSPRRVKPAEVRSKGRTAEQPSSTGYASKGSQAGQSRWLFLPMSNISSSARASMA